MTNENKLASMDAVGELPDFGNLLLREGGYPHLDDTPKQSPSNAWNDASILPTECKVYETKVALEFHPEDEPTLAYQYFDGWKFNFAAGSIDGALKYRDTAEFLKTTEWREVQP